MPPAVLMQYFTSQSLISIVWEHKQLSAVKSASGKCEHHYFLYKYQIIRRIILFLNVCQRNSNKEWKLHLTTIITGRKASRSLVLAQSFMEAAAQNYIRCCISKHRNFYKVLEGRLPNILKDIFP